MRIVQSDVCVIGGGISGAVLAAKLTAERQVSVTVVEAGQRLFDFENRFAYRERNLRYGENGWPGRELTTSGSTEKTVTVGGDTVILVSRYPRAHWPSVFTWTASSR